jgi:hypothetical protein
MWPSILLDIYEYIINHWSKSPNINRSVCIVDRCLYFIFWPLYCLFVIDIRILITPFVSSNSSSYLLIRVLHNWINTVPVFLMFSPPFIDCNETQTHRPNLFTYWIFCYSTTFCSCVHSAVGSPCSCELAITNTRSTHLRSDLRVKCAFDAPLLTSGWPFRLCLFPAMGKLGLIYILPRFPLA